MPRRATQTPTTITATTTSDETLSLGDAGEPVAEVAALGGPAICDQEQATGRKLGRRIGSSPRSQKPPAVRADRVPPATMPSRSVISQ